MANQYGLFWNSENSDRTYDADSFEEWLKKFFTTGVFNGDLQVTPASGMVVNIGTGYANVNGKVRFFDNASTKTVAAASGTYPRIDTIVVRRDNTNRQITLEYVAGQYNGQSPAPTAPTRTGGIYEIVLAQIYVDVGATSITAADITDKRPDSTVCGWVTGTVDSVDVDQITAQATAEFEDWFDAMKGQLSTDAAGALQNQINAINTKITPTISVVNMAASGWSNGVYSFESTYPSSSYRLEIELSGTATEEQMNAWASAQILGSATANVAIAKGDTPTIAIPIILTVWTL